MRFRRILPLLFLLSWFAAGLRAAAPAPSDALQLYRTKHYPEAQAAFEQIARAHPDNAAAAYYLGRLAEKRGASDEAVAWLEKAVALAPGNSAYFLELGGAYGDKARDSGFFTALDWAKKCRAALEHAVALDQQSVPARLGLLNFYRTAPAIAGGGMDRAIVQARAIRQLDPIVGGVVLASLFIRQGNYTDALATAEIVLRHQPDNPAALYDVGRCADQLGQPLDRGIAALQRWLALTPRPAAPPPTDVQCRLGGLYLKKGDRSAAILAYEAALKLDPGFAEAQTALAALKR